MDNAEYIELLEALKALADHADEDGKFSGTVPSAIDFKKAKDAINKAEGRE